ncbi:MAG: hypothetical protein ACNI25_09185 [Halarcobacter sp.]
MFILGATVGVPMGLLYTFPLFTKLGMILGLLLSFGAMIYGFRNHQKLHGQILAVAGILFWSFIGVLGLGTGT